MADGNKGKKYNKVASPRNKTTCPALDRAFCAGLPMMLTPASEAELDRRLGMSRVGCVEVEEPDDLLLDYEETDPMGDVAEEDRALFEAGD